MGAERLSASRADRRLPTLTTAQLMALAAAVVAFAAAAFAPQLLWDGDTFWHIRTGEWMLAHHQVVRVDPFSFTAYGRAWVDLEWLSEVLMAAVYGVGGFPLLDLMFGLCIGALTWILASALLRKLPVFTSAAALFLVLACTTQSWLARPHLLTLPILALWTVQLMQAREADRAPPLWLVPVMALWTNLHGSFLIGLALIGPFALEALVEARGAAARLQVVRGWGLFGVLALLACLVTPHGLNGLIYPVKLITMSSLPDIDEWKPSDFSRLQPLELSLLAALFACLYRGVRIPLVRLIVLLGLVHLTLHQTRHQMVLAVVGALLLAEPLARAIQGSDPLIPLARMPRRAGVGALAAILVAFSGVAAARAAMPARLVEVMTAPVSALAHVPAALRLKPVLNEYGMGGYLIFNQVRPYIDGRADMYGDDFVRDYMRIKKRDAARLRSALSSHGVQWTIFAADDPVVKDLDALPGWKRLYADKTAVVHVRTAA